MGQIPHTSTNILLLHRDPVEPELSHLCPQISRKSIFAIDRLGPWRDFVITKSANRLAQLVDLKAKVEIEGRIIVLNHSGHARNGWEAAPNADLIKSTVSPIQNKHIPHVMVGRNPTPPNLSRRRLCEGGSLRRGVRAGKEIRLIDRARLGVAED